MYSIKNEKITKHNIDDLYDRSVGMGTGHVGF